MVDGSGLRNADLDSALAEAREAYVARNPKSLARFVEAASVMPGGNTRSVLFHAPFPLGLARGEGAHLYDLDGAHYIDFLGEYTAGIYGHSHPGIRRAIEAALDGGINLGGHTMLEARFARAVTERFGLELVRFTNSGTEANLMALATAAAVTGRRTVLAFHGGYHGGVFTFAGGGSPVNAPYDFVLARYNDGAGAKAAIESQAGKLAAVIVEPMMGGGGCIPAEPEFLASLIAAAHEAGAVAIFDEVMTSRLAPGGLAGRYGLRPDIVTLGKYIGGGMSCGAFGGRAALLERFDPRRADALPHAGTFNNNVLTMSAGIAGLTEIYTKEAAEALNARGEGLRTRLNALCQQHGAPMQFTGIGSMMTVHFTAAPIRAPEDWATADPRLKELFFFDLLAAGFWIARRGMINLSLMTGEAECERLAEAVEEFLQARRPLLATAADGG
ncbi:MAG TPA: aminotransferase class III-fold pyridoxal phosphate-dependent enzyme [Acetobacteraceae bacterium]|nr:aminotransferase class III-fold pyridoxal phosphate-dependent enzyme [Acetobacteraceae bacterium]